jgi:hypothetical protein
MVEQIHALTVRTGTSTTMTLALLWQACSSRAAVSRAAPPTVRGWQCHEEGKAVTIVTIVTQFTVIASRARA